jgi:aspartyl protease family protein
MSNQGGPWGRDPVEPPAPARTRGSGRLFLWLVIVVALIAFVVALARAFPETALKANDWGSLGYLGVLLLVISAGVARATRGALVRHLRYAAIWAGIVALLALGVAYRDELAGVPRRLQLAFAGGGVATSDHELVIQRDVDQGGFLVVGLVNGQRVRFLIDTGATETVLSPDDARRLGVDVDSLAFDHLSETANGTGYGAAYTADSLQVGPIQLTDFKTTINRAPMSTSLLGMSFLSRLESFQVRGSQLILRWRDGDRV